MKKLFVIFCSLSMFLFSLSAKAQIKIRKDVKPADTVKIADASQKNVQVVQPTQPQQAVQSTQYQATSVKMKYYSVDQTSFSCSWGEYEIKRMYSEGAYLYSSSTLGTPAYLVAPVNLPHGATIVAMKVIFYDASATQDLVAILWQGGPNFGTPDSYNLGQIASNYNGGAILQSQALNAKVDNENHSYYVAVHPSNNTPWPINGELKIKRVTIAYTEAE